MISLTARVVVAAPVVIALFIPTLIAPILNVSNYQSNISQGVTELQYNTDIYKYTFGQLSLWLNQINIYGRMFFHQMIFNHMFIVYM